MLKITAHSFTTFNLCNNEIGLRNMAYRVVFNMRGEESIMANDGTLMACVNQIWYNTVIKGVPGLEYIREMIRPMGQLTSGLFLNLDSESLKDDQDWLNRFNVLSTTPMLNKYSIIKIADNYKRVQFSSNGNCNIKICLIRRNPFF